MRMLTQCNSLRFLLGVLITATVFLLPGCQKDKGHRFPEDEGDTDSIPVVKPLPEITEIIPNSGPLCGGGDLIVIKGDNFITPTEVIFGDNSAPFVDVVSDLELLVSVPKGDAAGPVDVTVRTSEGEFVAPGGYTYIATLKINAINPSQGPLSGGTIITISG